MADFNSKYTGEQVEQLLDQVASGNAGSGGGGGITVETDPIFSASPAATITEAKKSEWDNKMDKVTLATVATSGSYNDLADKPTIPDVSNKQDKLVSGTNIKTINNTSLLGSGNITVATQAYVDSKIGDINTILESIIGGGSYYHGLAQYSDEELLNIVDEALEG